MTVKLAMIKLNPILKALEGYQSIFNLRIFNNLISRIVSLQVLGALITAVLLVDKLFDEFSLEQSVFEDLPNFVKVATASFFASSVSKSLRVFSSERTLSLCILIVMLRFSCSSESSKSIVYSCESWFKA